MRSVQVQQHNAISIICSSERWGCLRWLYLCAAKSYLTRRKSFARCAGSSPRRDGRESRDFYNENCEVSIGRFDRLHLARMCFSGRGATPASGSRRLQGTRRQRHRPLREPMTYEEISEFWNHTRSEGALASKWLCILAWVVLSPLCIPLVVYIWLRCAIWEGKTR